MRAVWIFFVLMNSIDRDSYHSHDVLLAHLLITAVLVSWSFFLEPVKGLRKDCLSVLERTGLAV